MRERRLQHRGEAEKFFRDLAVQGVTVRVGMEATGHARWFERLMAELNFELWIGDAAEIRTKLVRKQKTDRQDAQLILRKEGSIVLTTGIAGQRPQKGWVIAASVCGTIEALTRALAVELAPIRVNAVSPGVVRTNLWQSMSAPERERLFESVGKSLPVGRVGEAHEIAQAYLFLMQEGFSTGQTVVADGGTVLV
jgi:NAD(P)-dependent dehydrogenase (short-subunit alcohol dehydrogenase family)